MTFTIIIIIILNSFAFFSILI